MKDIMKYLFPAAFLAAGLITVSLGLFYDQNGAFKFGAFSLLVAGVVSLLSVVLQLSKTIRFGISAVLILLIGGLTYANYMSIKVPIEFQEEKEMRYEHVIQRLKDIRTAELAYKSVHNKYTGSWDTLVSFIAHDSMPLIKTNVVTNDTLTREQALKDGIFSYDTLMVSVYDSLFGIRHMDGRVHPFLLDSLPYVPFARGAQFKLEASSVERSGVDMPVFQATDGAPFDKNQVLQVGSLMDPKTNGNWE